MKTKGQELGEQYAGAMISNDFVQYGLTKREYFAGLAMQGLSSSFNKEGEWTVDPKSSADLAVEIADALLEKLANN